MNYTDNSLRLLAILFAIAPVAACSNGPSESEIVEACLIEGKRGVNSAGMNRDTFCKCAAREAREALSADAQRVLVLGMSGKRSEANAISAKFSESEQAAAIKGTAAVLEKCIGAGGDRASGTGSTSRPSDAGGTPSGRYRAENAGESITLDFRDGQNVRVTLADGRTVLEAADGRYELNGDRITIRVPGGMPLVLTNRGKALEGMMDGHKVRFVRN